MSTRKFNNRKTGDSWFVGGVVAIWVISLLASLAVVGVVVWGVITLVNWLVTK